MDSMRKLLAIVETEVEQPKSEGKLFEWMKPKKESSAQSATCPGCKSSDIKTYSDGEKECHDCGKTWDIQDTFDGKQVSESTITELDNGPKGRVNTDPINYTTRSMAGTPYAARPDEIADRKAAASAEAAQRRATAASRNSRESRLADAREEEIPRDLSWDYIQKACERDSYGLGGDIADIISSKRGFIESDGVIVAARQVSLYVQFDPVAHGYDRETIDKYGMEEGLSDAISITLYRDPAKPRIIRTTMSRVDWV